MNYRVRLILAMLMAVAFFFGFLHLFIPRFPYNFERLHMFLFNLCCGGTVILYHSERRYNISKKTAGFLCLALCYALFAFAELYIPAIILSLFLAGIVETVRVKSFQFIPFDFFNKEDVSLKFHHASLLCLSIGLVISSLVILNNEYLKLISMPKLQLDTFFLGFSFPVSLITMSLIFSLMEKKHLGSFHYCKEVGFWSVNLGVIIFFLFIIFEKLTPQVFVTVALFMTVTMIFILYRKTGRDIQQKNFLTSGMAFLMVTAVTGIMYIFFQFTPDYNPDKYNWLLRVHSFASLYGWNLCGLSIICRLNDFPIKLHSPTITAVHWITVMLLAPVGNSFKPFALAATVSYIFILYTVLFSRADRQNAL